ncbi:hypothetical protein EV217_2868 [Phyllobacterium myrsinacearum]|uniref:hypothetical protein n=1 Tax=Phyllobacterium myrsinacearum TaxID=28101 RepID=UPI001028BAAF|nr:hypothetical protein [Phyllobacterium myrsinacearum]RZS82055.1 hypothetical protein EV217_2868 [Phyllobacterium myrsinacearum]
MSHPHRMLTNRELANWNIYIKANPYGPFTNSEGAFDAKLARKKRLTGIPLREFRRGGAYDAAPDDTEATPSQIKSISNVLMKIAKALSPEEWARLQRVLTGTEESDGEDELPENGIDDPRDDEDVPAMDGKAAHSFHEMFPHAARLIPDPYPRSAPVSTGIRAKDVASFNAMFPHANRLK